MLQNINKHLLTTLIRIGTLCWQCTPILQWKCNLVLLLLVRQTSTWSILLYYSHWKQRSDTKHWGKRSTLAWSLKHPFNGHLHTTSTRLTPSDTGGFSNHKESPLNIRVWRSFRLHEEVWYSWIPFQSGYLFSESLAHRRQEDSQLVITWPRCVACIGNGGGS